MLHILIPTTADRRERLATCLESIKAHAGIPYIVMTYENYREGFVGAIHKMLAGLKDDTLVWCIGDDTELTPGALQKLVDAHAARFPDGNGVSQPDDGIHGGKIITMPLTSAGIMKAFTYREYHHNYADNEFTIIMKHYDRYQYVAESVMTHAHWINNKAKKDDTYAGAMEKYKADGDLYEKRVADGFSPLNPEAQVFVESWTPSAM